MPAVPLHGQVALSGSAQQLDASDAAGGCVAYSIKAPLSNLQPAFIGGLAVTSGNGYQMDPGDEVTYERLSQNGQPLYQLRPSAFYAVGTSGDRVCWLASP